MKNNQKGFSIIEIVLVIAVVGLLGTVGLLVYKGHKKTTTPASVAKTSTPAAATPTGPVFATLPSGWIEYKNEANGFRMGYPKEWGVISKVDAETQSTPAYRDNTKNLQGKMVLITSKKEGFTVSAAKYGATIKPSADGTSWIVASENPAAADKYKVGDTYKTTTFKVNGGTVININVTDEDCTLPHWLVTTKTAYIQVLLPELCPLPATPGAMDRTLSDANQKAFDQMMANVQKTITIY